MAEIRLAKIWSSSLMRGEVSLALPVVPTIEAGPELGYFNLEHPEIGTF